MDGELQSLETASSELEQHIDTCEVCQEFLSTRIENDPLLKLLRQPNPLDMYQDNELFVKSMQPVRNFVLDGNEPFTMGHFQVNEKIGAGGMGVVFKAWDNENERIVAIKTIPADRFNPKLASRFRREILACARVTHPHVVSVYESGVYRGIPFYVMQYLSGQSLSAWIQNREISDEQAVEITIKIVGAIASCHKEKIVHRDINPSNIFVSDSGEPVLGDFGISKILDRPDLHETQTKGVVGTPKYMAPEQREGRSDRRSDIFGIGTVLSYCLAANELQQENVETRTDSGFEIELHDGLLRQIEDKNLHAICKKCLASSPDARYQAADEVVSELRLWKSGQRTLALIQQQKRSRRFFVGAGLALSAGATAYLWPQIMASVQPAWKIHRFQNRNEVSILDDNSRPLFGSKVFDLESKLVPLEDTFSFQSAKAPAGYTLFPNPGGPFRLRGQLCHTISGIGDASVGCFIGYHTKQNVQHAIVMRYNDVRPPLVPPSVKIALKGEVSDKNEFRVYPLTYDPSKKVPDTKQPVKNGANFRFDVGVTGRTWRDLEIVVKRDLITVRFGDQRLTTTLKRSQLTGYSSDPFYVGDVGLYAFDSALQFKNFFICQLD